MNVAPRIRVGPGSHLRRPRGGASLVSVHPFTDLTVPEPLDPARRLWRTRGMIASCSAMRSRNSSTTSTGERRREAMSQASEDAVTYGGLAADGPGLVWMASPRSADMLDEVCETFARGRFEQLCRQVIVHDPATI